VALATAALTAAAAKKQLRKGLQACRQSREEDPTS
jgi:hypothetical protein